MLSEYGQQRQCSCNLKHKQNSRQYGDTSPEKKKKKLSELRIAKIEVMFKTCQRPGNKTSFAVSE